VPVGAHPAMTTTAVTRTFRIVLAIRSTFLGADTSPILVPALSVFMLT